MTEHMTDTQGSQDPFAELDTLLDRERSALVEGDLQQLSMLLERKEQLLEEIAKTEGPANKGLEALQGKAIRNQALLDSALQGIRSVANRFATLRRIRKSLETYDEFGHKSSLPALSENKVEKRA
ncbi:flagellar protein FlgN [Pseudooceanicola sp. MF1-13]|uniref:flagellar protein FlgN n=1 Tax=Pseudooceanicola sp. MF1-13 TaxID=3379095 RepID=UPI003892C37C